MAGQLLLGCCQTSRLFCFAQVSLSVRVQLDALVMNVRVYIGYTVHLTLPQHQIVKLLQSLCNWSIPCTSKVHYIHATLKPLTNKKLRI